MRSNMKWLYILSCLLAVAVATKTASATGVLNDPSEPGSVLVFPLFETGVTPGGATPITQFEISVVCPNGSVCTDTQDVDIRLHWVCSQSLNCAERDFTLATTVNGTLRFDPQGNCSPPNSANNFFDTCGNIPPPGCREGYLIAWVVDESNGAIKFDGLIGDAVLRENVTAVTAYNAVPIQAGAKLATGASTNLYHNGHLNFNGQAYKELTNTIIGSVHYDGLDPATGITSTTSLVLLTLDTRSNALNNPVNVDFNFYNEIEQLNSNNTIFFCHEELFLGGIGETNTFGLKGLVESTSAMKVPFLGTGDITGPVTLLGLVLTREDGDVRHYAYPLFDDSIPLATSFAP
jgi:hypothetical protein